MSSDLIERLDDLIAEALADKEAEVERERSRADALAAEVERLKEAQWQPIETAPHGQIVLLTWKDSFLPTWSYESGFASHGTRGDFWSTVSLHGQATHWMPLPAPPVARAALQPQEGEKP